jgi:hypothetical protein
MFICFEKRDDRVNVCIDLFLIGAWGKSIPVYAEVTMRFVLPGMEEMTRMYRRHKQIQSPKWASDICPSNGPNYHR